jgi:hypothetical protein
MNRVGLVLGVSVVMAAMVALTVGSALAKNTKPKADYIDKVVAEQYFAAPGIGMFRGAATDIESDGDPGLTAQVDARITYSGAPGPGVETTITGGTWILCSEFTSAPDFRSTPQCTPDSAIALEGTVVSGGTAEWDTNGGYALVPTPRGPILVYAGEAKVEAGFTNVSGRVDGVSVSGGTGKFEGTLHHQPLLDGKNPILEGTLELTF